MFRTYGTKGRKGQNAATGLGNLIGGLFVAGLVVSVPLGIAHIHTSNKPLEGDIKILEVNTPDTTLTVVDEPNRAVLESYLPFEVRYLEPIIYTGFAGAFGLGYVTSGIVAKPTETKRKSPKTTRRRGRA